MDVNASSKSVWLAFAFSFSCILGCRQDEAIKPFAQERIEITAEHDGATFHLVDNGHLYREVDGGNHWVYHDTVFDPQLLRDAYRTKEGQLFRFDAETRREFSVRNTFSESFEDIPRGEAGLGSLVHESRQLWGSVTLQSPLAPEVSDYVSLRAKIMRGESPFLDARVEAVDERASLGQQSLRCEVPPRTDEMVTCKASASTPLVCFKNGDDFWFQGDFWFEEGLPMTIADLECEFVEQHPGIRIRLYDDGALGAELKAIDKPQYRQNDEQRVRVPKDRWVTIRVHIHLSASSDGRIQIWQDGKQVLDCKGVTFPFRSAVYSSFEVGITAYSELSHRCVLMLDNLHVGNEEGDIAR